MIWAAMLLLAAAQEPGIEQGARVYRTHCSIPYCHGADGAAGRAPKLIGHGLTTNALYRIVTWGIPGTGMPGFTKQLRTGEIASLVGYLMTLAGSPAAPASIPPEPVPPPEVKPGRALFFDAARMGGCGACHELDGWGAAVGPDLSALKPERFQDLGRIPQSRVMTAHPAGEAPFPALLVEQNQTRIRLYDLTAPLPVLRSFSPGQVTLNPGGSWRHAEVTRGYSERDLESIGRYLRWLSSARPR